jgi:hypothetical protein
MYILIGECRTPRLREPLASAFTLTHHCELTKCLLER